MTRNRNAEPIGNTKDAFICAPFSIIAKIINKEMSNGEKLKSSSLDLMTFLSTFFHKELVINKAIIGMEKPTKIYLRRKYNSPGTLVTE